MFRNFFNFKSGDECGSIFVSVSKMKTRKIKVIISLFAALLLLSAFNRKEPAARNLQILPKDISEQQLDEVMTMYCESLKVECSYCHIPGDMASDSLPEKRITRHMMQMTNEINEKYFGKNSGVVGCMTCHNGKINPNDAH